MFLVVDTRAVIRTASIELFPTIPIDGSLSYVITGCTHASGPTDVTFFAHQRSELAKHRGTLSGTDLVVDSDSFYIITVNSSSADNQTNHIQSTLLAKQLLLRNNLGNWNTKKPDNLTVDLWRIPRVTMPSPRQRPSSPQHGIYKNQSKIMEWAH